MAKNKPQEDWDNYLTVGNLRASLEGLPADMPVFYHRIEDIYFEKHGWMETVLGPVAEGVDHSHLDSLDGCRKGWIRALSTFVDRVKGRKKRVLCITAHY